MRSILGSFFQNQASTSGTLPSNTIPNPKGEMKAITTRSGVAYEGPSIPTNPSPKKVVERETEETTDKEQSNFQGSTAHIPPPVNPIPIPEPDVLKTLPKPNIPYPSRRNDQKSREKASNQMEKIFQIFQDLRFDISFADALLLMPRFAPTIKSLHMNKEKLLELAKIPLNENYSAMLLKKILEKLGDPDKFLIPCDFLGMDDDILTDIKSKEEQSTSHSGNEIDLGITEKVQTLSLFMRHRAKQGLESMLVGVVVQADALWTGWSIGERQNVDCFDHVELGRWSIIRRMTSDRLLMPRVVKSRDEIFSRWGYCDNHDLSRLDNQSIERDRLIGIGFVLNFVKFISFTFGDKEMISVIEAVSR
ncbi:hypothetical protein Tco_0971922 [Tanacetum coccineum]